MKRVLEEREPAEWTELIENQQPIQFVDQVCAPVETLRDANQKLIDEVDAKICTWGFVVSDVAKRALRIVAMYVVEKYAWMSTDDLNITRITDLLITNSFRAHKDGVCSNIKMGPGTTSRSSNTPPSGISYLCWAMPPRC